MSSKFLDIPGKKNFRASVSSDDDDHSFIILNSFGANSLSYDKEIEFISASPIMEIWSESNDTDVETLINSELDGNDNDLYSIPEICESLMATIQPGVLISAEDSYINVLKENLEEIVTKFGQMKGMTICLSVNIKFFIFFV